MNAWPPAAPPPPATSSTPRLRLRPTPTQRHAPTPTPHHADRSRAQPARGNSRAHASSDNTTRPSPHVEIPRPSAPLRSVPLSMVSASTLPLPPQPQSDAAGSGEDASKKVRKPYTITKSRESWTEQEHDKFLEALQLFDRDWKKIEAFVGSKTVIQIRSHAQKYFLKVQKNGTSEHVPPPRPKRKASHPYPQKASKNEPNYGLKTDSSSIHRNSGMNTTVSSWAVSSVPPAVASSMVKDLGTGALGPNNFCSSSTEGPPRTWQPGETNDQINQVPSLRLMPDFAQVYSFLGSVFDPSTSGHLQKLKEMNPIDVETVLLLMRNLSINLTSPDFEDQRKLLSSYSTSDGLELGSSRSSTLATSAPFMIKGE